MEKKEEDSKSVNCNCNMNRWKEQEFCPLLPLNNALDEIVAPSARHVTGWDNSVCPGFKQDLYNEDATSDFLAGITDFNLKVMKKTLKNDKRN